MAPTATLEQTIGEVPQLIQKRSIFKLALGAVLVLSWTQNVPILYFLPVLYHFLSHLFGTVLFCDCCFLGCDSLAVDGLCGRAHRFRGSCRTAETGRRRWETAPEATFEEIVIITKKWRKSSESAQTTRLTVFPAVEETAEEIIFLVVELVGWEKFSEDIVGLAEVEVAEGCRFGAIEAVAIIDLSLFRFREVLVGLGDFSKLLYCLIATVGVFIGVPPDCQLLVCLLDVRLSGWLAQAEHLVVVSLRHPIIVLL